MACFRLCATIPGKCSGSWAFYDIKDLWTGILLTMLKRWQLCVLSQHLAILTPPIGMRTAVYLVACTAGAPICFFCILSFPAANVTCPRQF